MPSKSVSPDAMLRYGKRQPEGVVKLSSSIFTIELSATTVFFRAAGVIEAREINPLNGEESSLLSASQIAEGIFLVSNFAGRGELTSGKSSVIRPRGSGLVLL